MVLCSIALHANVVTGTCGDNLTWSYDTDTKALTIEGSGAMTDYGYGNAPWAQVNVDILSVSLPEGLTSIGSYAFLDCKALTSFIIPDGVTSIGEYAFHWCTSLTSVTIPHSVNSIGDCAFFNCPLISVTIPNSVTSIGGGGTFNLCSQVIVECTTPFTIGSGTFNTSASIFVPCSAFDTYLQAQVWGFLNLKGLSHIVNLSATKGGKATITATDCDANTATIKAVADNLYQFSQWSDGNTDNPRIVSLTQDTTLVATFAAYDMGGKCGDNLTWSYDTDTKALTIEGTGDMYDYGYDGAPWAQVNSSILSVSLPDGLTGIGSNAFRGCSSLTSITIPNSVNEIGSYAFNECSSITSVTLSNQITNIGRDVFCDCYSLRSITIPNSVTNIGEGSLARCYALTTIIIPNSVTSIERNAFVSCYNLTSVSIGNSVTSIGESAFRECSSLTSITIPNSVTSIGDRAFEDCSSLTSITIPNSVTRIGDEVFPSCSQVIVECTTPPSIESGTFKSDATIYVPCFTVGIYLAAPVWQFLSIVDDDTYRVNLSVTEGGKATITATDCDANTATIEAVADNLYQFSQWSDGNTDNPRTLTLTQDTTLQAEFSTTYYIAGNDEALFGSVWEPNGCMLEKQADGTYAKSFTNCIPGHRYQFKITNGSWEYNWGCNSVLEPSFIACDLNENINVFPATSNLKVIFDPTTELITVEGELYQEQPKYNVTLRGIDLYGYYQYTDSWGGISDVWFDDRTEISFTIESGLSVRITEEGYCGTWLGWSDGVTDYERTITITSDTVITSRFDVPTYQVNISAAANGSLTQYGEPIGNIETTMTDCDSDGEWIDICAVPDEGYYFTGWSDGYAYACRGIEVVSDTTLVAHFAEKHEVQVLVGVEPACKNMGTVSGSGIFYQGDVVTITATPNEGYHFVEWSDGNSIANRDIYLTSDTTLFATFAAGDMGGKCGDNLYWKWDNGALTITGSGDMDLSTHPAWWQYPIDIQSVSFPEAMTSISAYAFYGYNSYTVYQAPYSLKEAIIPANVTYIGYASFAGCPQLTKWQYNGTQLEVQYAEGYGYDVFNGDEALTFLQAPAELVEYRNNSWSNLDTLIVISGEIGEVPSNVRYLDLRNATNSTLRLNGWENLTTLYLPNGSTEIADKALLGCKHLGGILIPADVTRIGESAFEDCRSMDSVVFAGNKVEEIGAWAFYNCHSLRSLTLPEGVEEVGLAAFYGCTYLKELTIPSTMKKIADNGFAGCEKMEKMYVNALVPPTIEAKTFEDVNRATPVFVPKGTLERYQADEYWSEFFNMAEYEAPTGNLNTAAEDNGLRKVVRNGQVLIIRGDKTYTILGEAL